MNDIEPDRPAMLSDLVRLETTLRNEVAGNGQSLAATLREEMMKQSEEDRRHFRMLAEDVRDSVRIVAEATAQQATRLNDHETRLRTLEKPA